MEKNEHDQKRPIVRVIASQKNWIESDAIKQLEHQAKLPGMQLVVGLPDLHPGKSYPIGAAFLSEGWIYPHLVGNDIGCGMGFWKTNLDVKKLKLDKWEKDLEGLEMPWEGDVASWLDDEGVSPTLFDYSLGTIGGGNHFAELQKVESIQNDEKFEDLHLNKKEVYLLVHSGSRGLGESILRSHIESHGDQGVYEGTEDADHYLHRHDHAVRWAKVNRKLIAHRFLSCLHTQATMILDVSHNTVTKHSVGDAHSWIHRKGAAPSTEGPIVIPGSRGHLSYLVQPIPQEQSAYSLAHGAGRKWKRTDAKGRLAKYRMEDFVRTSLGSRVICEDKNLIFEEAPQAYKCIDTVVSDLVDAGLVDVIATFRPLITYKTRRGS